MQANPALSNYCACFIDLLGQKNLLQGQSIMPDKADIQAYERFTESAYKAIGAINELQNRAAHLMRGTEKFSMRDQIPESELATYEEMKAAKPKQQRWSDGLVLYHSLATDKLKCPMNAVMEIFMLSGTLCLLGLASGTPIRGAIEVSWGVELHDNELYGAVVANSYILESTVAQYPRVVVGPHVITYLKSHLQESLDLNDKINIYNRNLAVYCLKMTATDKDGYSIINYLGQDFKDLVLSGEDEPPSLYEMACKYIAEQYSEYSAQIDNKLAIRYAWLKGYFEQHRPIHTIST
ncbi:hypothetical protein B2J88_48840 [Rhodococcus sp. SRB_17]|uniref:hypothetical protein n=1 Tax=Acidovorax sp. SRB_24 TaxID=1962700 RepID=UPI00145D0F9C|nr:hypothetical protein [Acidovorax sp. SRB_24]NMM92080.1 hypothetical protein [Rhodococcus sp. SRB_17]